jgi:hypothetical protein
MAETQMAQLEVPTQKVFAFGVQVGVGVIDHRAKQTFKMSLGFAFAEQSQPRKKAFIKRDSQ